MICVGNSDGLFSALPAGMLSFASPKESSQRLLLAQLKGDPNLRGRLRRLPCATQRNGRLRNSARWASDSARRQPPLLFRCSALPMGTRNTDRSFNAIDDQYTGRSTTASAPQPLIDQQTAKHPSVFNSPSASSSSAGRPGVFGLHGLSRRRVHARRPAGRAAQSTRNSRATRGSRLLFGDFFLAKQEKVTRASGAKPNASAKTKPHSSHIA